MRFMSGSILCGGYTWQGMIQWSLISRISLRIGLTREFSIFCSADGSNARNNGSPEGLQEYPSGLFHYYPGGKNEKMFTDLERLGPNV